MSYYERKPRRSSQRTHARRITSADEYDIRNTIRKTGPLESLEAQVPSYGDGGGDGHSYSNSKPPRRLQPDADLVDLPFLHSHSHSHPESKASKPKKENPFLYPNTIISKTKEKKEPQEKYKSSRQRSILLMDADTKPPSTSTAKRKKHREGKGEYGQSESSGKKSHNHHHIEPAERIQESQDYVSKRSRRRSAETSQRYEKSNDRSYDKERKPNISNKYELENPFLLATTSERRGNYVAEEDRMQRLRSIAHLDRPIMDRDTPFLDDSPVSKKGHVHYKTTKNKKSTSKKKHRKEDHTSATKTDTTAGLSLVRVDDMSVEISELSHSHRIRDSFKDEDDDTALGVASVDDEKSIYKNITPGRRTLLLMAVVTVVLAVAIIVVIALKATNKIAEVVALPEVVPTIAPTTQTPGPSSAPTTAASGLLELLSDVSVDGGGTLFLTTSPQYRAYEWLVTNPVLPRYSRVEKIQRYVLATLYFSTRGENWKYQHAWLTDEDECEWYTSETQYSICNFVGEVDELDLVRNTSARSIHGCVCS
jgi:hypothetical protein